MPPRRQVGGVGRGVAGAYAHMNRQIEDLHAEIARLTSAINHMGERRPRVRSNPGSDSENMSGEDVPDVEVEGEPLPQGEEGQRFENRLIQALEGIRGNRDGIKNEVPEYAGGLKPEELIDWVNSMEKYFEWGNLAEAKKVKLACTKLKGHALIWWDHLQASRQRKEKEKIKTWAKMKKKL